MDDKKKDIIYKHVKAYQFEMGAKEPISWKAVSLCLKHAADRLYDLYYEAHQRNLERLADELRSGKSFEGTRTLEGKELEDLWDTQLIRPYFLLIGYAIENLLKAILMVKHPEYFKSNKKMKEIKSHDLKGLCDFCTIKLAAEEAELLEKLTYYIEWQGKYPIPLEADKMFPKKRGDSEWLMAGEAYQERKTQQEMDALFLKIWSELESLDRTRSIIQ